MRIPARLATSLLLLALPACATIRPGGSGVGGAPSTFVRLATEAQISRTIPVKNGGAASSWRTLTEYLSASHTIAVRDQSAGFAMTAWEATLAREGVPDLRYRTRLVVSFVGEDWKQLNIRAEANWKEGDEWQVGYDRELLDRVTAELAARLGAPAAAPSGAR
jgi:hypothetical protein